MRTESQQTAIHQMLRILGGSSLKGDPDYTEIHLILYGAAKMSIHLHGWHDDMQEISITAAHLSTEQMLTELRR